MNLFAGHIVFGRFELLKCLGGGAWTEVWAVRDHFHRHGTIDLALKLLVVDPDEHPHAIRRLAAEADRMMELEHPNLLKPLELVRERRRVALLLEAAEAGSLADVRRRAPGGVLPLDTVQRYLLQVCDGLACSHRAGILHRDLKPHNLLLFRGDLVKISDFGISCNLTEEATRGMTIGVPTGTVAYMSPQQLNGEIPTVRDDIYSLGATVYELLTSRPPFYSGHIARQIETRLPDSIGGRRAQLGLVPLTLPNDWEDMLMACLAKDPADRPATVEEVAACFAHRGATSRYSRAGREYQVRSHEQNAGLRLMGFATITALAAILLTESILHPVRELCIEPLAATWGNPRAEAATGDGAAADPPTSSANNQKNAASPRTHFIATHPSSD